METEAMMEIQKVLLAHRDPAYAEFIARSIPTLPKESFIGIRSPEYRKIRKELPEAAVSEAFLEELPHSYYEENVLHTILLGEIRDFDACLEKVERFLPYVDNWAVCDGLNPPALGKELSTLRERISVWMDSDAPYTQRFGMRMTMIHFLTEAFDPAMLDQAAAIRSEEYYVNMMRAWLFAEALIKQWDSAIVYLEDQRMDPWTHNKTIQKAVESFRLTDERKNALKALRRKGKR